MYRLVPIPNISLSVLLLTLIHVDPDPVSTFYIKETGEQFQRKPGDSIQFTCTVSGRDFDTFTNIIQWKKSQDYDSSATYVISQHGQILEGTPFFKTSRFSVTGNEIPVVQEYSQHSESDYVEYGQPDYGLDMDYMVTLSIYNLQPEDSGMYWCDVQGGETITHKLEILESVQEVRIGGRTDAYSAKNEMEGDYQKYFSNRDGVLSCVSIGGYPDPVLNVYATTRSGLRDDITHFTYKANNLTLIGDTPGLQKYRPYIKRFSSILNLDPKYDRGTITCEGAVDKRVPPRSASIDIVVYSPPMHVRGECPEIVGAEIGDVNAEIRCRFKANPIALEVAWLANTTELLQVDETELYLTKFSGVGMHEYEATFVIKNVTVQSFQYYELTVTNNLDTLYTPILLKEGYGASDDVRPSLLAVFLPLCVLSLLGIHRHPSSS